MPSRSSYAHRAVLYLALLSACTNGPEATSDSTSNLAGTPPPAAAPNIPPAATGPAAPTAAPSATPAMSDGVVSPGASPESTSEYRELIAADWELGPGTEQYICVRQTLAETTFVRGWRGDLPTGTHHLVLTTSEAPDGEPDGQAECDVATVGLQNVLGLGVGSGDRHLPPGVAVKLAQGDQLLLNLHLFNPTDRPLLGRSAVRAQTMEEKDIRELADRMQASLLKLDVPPGRSTSQGRCTFQRDATVFDISPHMHQTGVAIKAVAHTMIHGDVVLYDGPYNFESQQAYPLDLLQFKAGDTVDVTCTYENTTGRTIHWGGSSNDEMCQVGLGRFPAGGPSLCAK